MTWTSSSLSPHTTRANGSPLDYAAVAEISGWSPVIAPEAINCAAPDTGNMETLQLADQLRAQSRSSRISF